MIAANFSSIFLIFAEAMWIQCLLFAKETGFRVGGLMASGASIAVIAGIALLTPMVPGALASSSNAVKAGFYNWITLQPISWPYTTLRDGVGGYTLFWTFIILGTIGLWRQWRLVPFASAFFALCTLGSILTPVVWSAI
jgi:hypothetical protein